MSNETITRKDSFGTYYELHKRDNTPIVFIHGVGLDHGIWEYQIYSFDNTVLTYVHGAALPGDDHERAARGDLRRLPGQPQMAGRPHPLQQLCAIRRSQQLAVYTFPLTFRRSAVQRRSSTST